MNRSPPLTLWAESDDSLLPPPGQAACPLPKDEVARLNRKLDDIEESMTAAIARQRARLQRVEEEIETLTARAKEGMEDA